MKNKMIDNRQARRLMERMGLSMKELEGVKEVMIITEDKEIRLINPQVFEINAKGSRVFQITSDKIEETAQKPEFKEEDIALIMSQTGVSREVATAALTESNGDIALAIMRLKS